MTLSSGTLARHPCRRPRRDRGGRRWRRFAGRVEERTLIDTRLIAGNSLANVRESCPRSATELSSSKILLAPRDMRPGPKARRVRGTRTRMINLLPQFRAQPAAESPPPFALASAAARGGRFAKVRWIGNLAAQIWHRSSPSGLKARQRRPRNCRRQRCGDERENGMAATTNRARAGDALRPSKLFDGARPGPARPRGKAELADSHHLRSQSQSSPQLRAGRARSGQIKRKRLFPNQDYVRP